MSAASKLRAFLLVAVLGLLFALGVVGQEPSTHSTADAADQSATARLDARTGPRVSGVSAAAPVDHSAFTDVLQTYVDADGNVDYAALKTQRDEQLTPYLNRLAQADPSGWDRDERLAFWINAYNALTIDLILEHYPVESIWAVTPGAGPSASEKSPFTLDVGVVADTMRSLDEIEHEIIRVRFDEPRIHFAVVCAAVSCPTLRREAYVGARLDAQLDEQTRAFVRNPAKNEIPAEGDTARFSRIVSWYQQDFGNSPAAVQRFYAPYAEAPAVRRRLEEAAYAVDYLPYDWTLNAQAPPGS
jgi:hypothetical protein